MGDSVSQGPWVAIGGEEKRSLGLTVGTHCQYPQWHPRDWETPARPAPIQMTFTDPIWASTGKCQLSGLTITHHVGQFRAISGHPNAGKLMKRCPLVAQVHRTVKVNPAAGFKLSSLFLLDRWMVGSGVPQISLNIDTLACELA